MTSQKTWKVSTFKGFLLRGSCGLGFDDARRAPEARRNRRRAAATLVVAGLVFAAPAGAGAIDEWSAFLRWRRPLPERVDRALAAFGRGDDEGVLAVFGRAAREPRARVLRALALRRSGRPIEAASELESMLGDDALFGLRPLLLWEWMQARIDAGAPAGASALLGRHVPPRTRDERALFRAWGGVEPPREARRDDEDAFGTRLGKAMAEGEPLAPALFHQAALLALADGRFEPALEIVEWIPMPAERGPYARLLEGQARFGLGDAEGAVATWVPFRHRPPATSAERLLREQATLFLAAAEAELGRPEAAAATSRGAVSGRAGREAVLFRASLALDRGEPALALAEARDADGTPGWPLDHAIALLRVEAEALELAGDPRGAATALEAALERLDEAEAAAPSHAAGLVVALAAQAEARRERDVVRRRQLAEGLRADWERSRPATLGSVVRAAMALRRRTVIGGRVVLPGPLASLPRRAADGIDRAVGRWPESRLPSAAVEADAARILENRARWIAASRAAIRASLGAVLARGAADLRGFASPDP